MRGRFREEFKKCALIMKKVVIISDPSIFRVTIYKSKSLSLRNNRTHISCNILLPFKRGMLWVESVKKEAHYISWIYIYSCSAQKIWPQGAHLNYFHGCIGYNIITISQLWHHMHVGSIGSTCYIHFLPLYTVVPQDFVTWAPLSMRINYMSARD